MRILRYLFPTFLFVCRTLAQEVATETESEVVDLDTVPDDTVEEALSDVLEDMEEISNEPELETDSEESSLLEEQVVMEDPEVIMQSGPFVDLFGQSLLKLELIDETHAQLQPYLTNEVLEGKKVIGLYFSAVRLFRAAGWLDSWMSTCLPLSHTNTQHIVRMDCRLPYTGLVWTMPQVYTRVECIL